MTAMLSPILAHPLFGILLTVAIYWAAVSAWRQLRHHPLVHPVLTATLAVAMILVVLGVQYAHYQEQTALLTAALSVVIVLLAVPLYRHAGLIIRAKGAIGISLAAGSVVAISSALALPYAAGSSAELLATLAPKSTTAAVAMEVAEKAGGLPSLAAVVVISTGIFGAVFGPAILNAIGVGDERAQGFALGVASHAIGTARAFQISGVAGAFASLGMVLNALLTIVLVPVCLAIMV